MESTVQETMIESSKEDEAIFLEYQQKYPKVVEKILLKFEKFNLNYSQLVRFIQI